MDETLLRNSQLFLGLGLLLDPSYSVEEVEMDETLMRDSELETVLGAWGWSCWIHRFQIAAGEVEKAVEEALMQEVERKQPEAASGGPAFPGTSPSTSGSGKGWAHQAPSHVQNVF